MCTLPVKVVMARTSTPGSRESEQYCLCVVNAGVRIDDQLHVNRTFDCIERYKDYTHKGAKGTKISGHSGTDAQRMIALPC